MVVSARRHGSSLIIIVCSVLLCSFVSSQLFFETITPKLSEERMVFEITQGTIEFAFYPEVAPVTTTHVFEMVAMGVYTTNQFFRVDKNFVAQTSEAASGRLIPLNAEQSVLAAKNVPLEVKPGVKHLEGVVSMARGGAPDSGGSSIFFMLGEARHLDLAYAAFGIVTKGMDVLHALELLPTKREGIFVMPIDRVTILNTYWYRAHGPLHLSLEKAEGEEEAGGGTGDDTGDPECAAHLEDWKTRYASQADELQKMRAKCLPGS
ncbi:hypothetical protein FOA52_012329 [Chlamydomonas sp. UWO 241]|nr:hypothetical protein FOA52_012329 [Chlamydomonas sp. UWO 241]